MNKLEFFGKNPEGKRILVVSGVHGNELTPIYTSLLLSKINFEQYDFDKLTLISSVNYPGIVKNTREIPNTTTNDINRMFGSDEMIDFDDFKKHLEENDVIIDIHSSPKCTEFVLLNQDDKTNSYVEFCETCGIDYTIQFSANNTIKKFCLEKNKISFTLEINSLNYIDFESAERGKNIILNILRNINNFIQKISEPIYETGIYIFTYKKGLFIENIKCGEIVEYKSSLGKILNIDNFQEDEILLEKKGKFKVICFGDTNYVDAQNPICLLQPIVENL